MLGLVAILFAFSTWLLIQLLQSRGSTPPSAGAAEAHIVIDATEADGRKTTFESTVQLSAAEMGGLSTGELMGKGTGPFRQIFVSDQCGFTISWSGNVAVDVVARTSDKAVQVSIGGPVTEAGTWPGADCLGGTYYAPNQGATSLDYSCTFENVDLTHAGTYRAPTPEEAPNPYGCRLDFRPK